MTSTTECNQSKWISFLRHYGPINKNDQMYDEFIQRSLRRANLDPIKFDAIYMDELIENFRSDQPKNIILTGTAGDGKTFYCRKVWEKLGGSPEDWEAESDSKTKEIELLHHKLVIVKDLSELKEENKPAVVESIATSILEANSTVVFLVAANDGQLIEAISKSNNARVNELKAIIEELLVFDKSEKESTNIKLYNLSRQSTAKIFPSILNSILNHSGWKECAGCPYLAPENQSKKCPIIENKDRLSETNDHRLMRERLIDLLELCDLKGFHLPVRQLLILTANMLLGHPSATDKLMRCKDVPTIIDQGTQSKASIYRNVFGENLGLRKRNSIDVFTTLNRFGIGKETNNSIDNLLIFGLDNPELRDTAKKLLQEDEYYGADNKFLVGKNLYIERSDSNNVAGFLNLMRAQRQRIFFTMNNSLAESLNIWELTVFHSAGTFLNEVFRQLKESKDVKPKIVSDLVKGLNRIFTGLLLKDNNELLLATSGSLSQAKVSLVFEERVSVFKRRGEYVTLDMDRNGGGVQLVVSLSSNESVRPVILPMNLMRFEYLMRVSQGALPGSFSQECYEDILAFKSRILQRLDLRRHVEGDEQDDADTSFSLIQLGQDGFARTQKLEI